MHNSKCLLPFASIKLNFDLGRCNFQIKRNGECHLFDTAILQTREFADLSQHLWSSQVPVSDPSWVLTLLMHLSPHQKLFGWPGAQAVVFIAAPSDHRQLEGVLYGAAYFLSNSVKLLMNICIGVNLYPPSQKVLPRVLFLMNISSPSEVTEGRSELELWALQAACALDQVYQESWGEKR